MEWPEEGTLGIVGYSEVTVDAAPVSERPGNVINDGSPIGSGCRAREVLALVGDKWSVFVVLVLHEAGTLRFAELRRRVNGISQRMLTVTLRGLERDGLVSRVIYPEVPPRVEYTLTSLGATLPPIVGSLLEWAMANLPQMDAARARYDGSLDPRLSSGV